MDKKTGWLKGVLDNAQNSVNSWPDWKKSAGFNTELAKLKKEKVVAQSGRPASFDIKQK